MKKLFKWLLVLLAILVICFVFILFNPGLIKAPLEEYLSNLAGYSVTLEGDLNLDIGKRIEISASNIHVSGPGWARHQNLVELDHLQAVLVTDSLFKNIMVLESLQVDGLQLNLEIDASGKSNWQIAHQPTTPAKPENDEDNRTVVIFRNINISDTQIRYINGKTEVDHLLNIISLEQNHQADNILRTAIKGDFNNRPIDYSGTIGPYDNLLRGTDIRFTADGRFGELELKGNGLIDDVLKPRRPVFDLSLQGPDVDEITAMLGADDLGSGKFFLRATGAEVNDHYQADIDGNVGDVSLNVSAQASDLSKLEELDLQLSTNGPNLGAFMRFFGVQNWPDKPFSLRGDIDRFGSTLNISDLTLNIGGTKLVLDSLLTNFPELDASRIKLSVTGDDVANFRDLLGLPGIANGPFEIKGKLDVSAEEIELLQVDLKTSLGEATLSGTLGAAPDYIGSKFQLHLDGDNAQALLSSFGVDALPVSPFNLNTRFELVENGVSVERSVLVTIDDDRLELGGFIALKPGIEGSRLELNVSGNDLAQILTGVVDTASIPNRPYVISSQVSILDKGLEFEAFNAELEGIRLGATGSVKYADQLTGSVLDFQVSSEDLYALGIFQALDDSLDAFLPGQPFKVAGRVKFEKNGHQFSDVNGRVGKTDFTLNSLVSNQPGIVGSNVRFSFKGPGLNYLLKEKEDQPLPVGAFDAHGQINLENDQLQIKDLNFKTELAFANVNVDIDWPVSKDFKTNFNVDIGGQDIRNLLSDSGSFEPAKASFKLTAVGKKQASHLSFEKFDANIGNLGISMQGEFGGNADIAFHLKSADISALGRLNGKALPAMAVEIKSDLKGNTRQFVSKNLVIQLDQSHLEGELEVSLDGPRPVIKLVAESKLIDIRPFLNQDDTETDEAETKPDPGQKLIPATPLPLESLAAADIVIKLNISELKLKFDSIRNLNLDAETVSGKLNLTDFSYQAPLGKFKTSGSIIPTGENQADLNIDLLAQDFILNVSGQSKENLHLIPSLNIDFHAEGSGSNIQEVAGSMDGHFYLESSGGMLEGVNLSILDTFILDEIFSLVLPKSTQKDNLNLVCAATILNIENGLIKTDPGLTFTTDQIALIAKGTLDLKTEKMNFNFNAIPNNALKISAGELFNPYILVSGTLSKPAVGIDPGKALLHGGAAIGTAGISILAKGLIDRVGNAVPMCQKIREAVRQNINQTQ